MPIYTAFFSLTHLLARSLSHSLFFSPFYRSTHNEHIKPLLFAICFYFSLFPASFSIKLARSLARSVCHTVLNGCHGIKVSKVKVWSCHDTTLKYNEWGKWHISARAQRARPNTWMNGVFFFCSLLPLFLCTHPAKRVPFGNAKTVQAIRLGPNTSHQDYNTTAHGTCKEKKTK